MPSKKDGSPLMSEELRQIRAERREEIREQRDFDRRMLRMLPWLFTLVLALALYYTLVHL